MIHKQSPRMADRRSLVEVLVLKEILEEAKIDTKWVSSERMLADGLTKVAQRQSLADFLRYSLSRIVDDPNFVASKKKSKEERQAAKEEGTGGGAKKRSKSASVVSTRNQMAQFQRSLSVAAS